MASEFIPHSRQHFLREGVFLTRTESREERGRQDVARYRFLDGGHDSPAPRARILYGTRESRQIGILGECHGGEIQQPRSHYAPAPPQFRDVGKVEIVSMILGQFLKLRSS
jgi:hypothetical protein